MEVLKWVLMLVMPFVGVFAFWSVLKVLMLRKGRRMMRERYGGEYYASSDCWYSGPLLTQPPKPMTVRVLLRIGAMMQPLAWRSLHMTETTMCLRAWLFGGSGSSRLMRGRESDDWYPIPHWNGCAGCVGYLAR